MSDQGCLAFTVFYPYHPLGNLMHKHKAITFDEVGERPATVADPDLQVREGGGGGRTPKP